MGGSSTTPETLPTIIPGLQNRSVISVVKGFGYFSALTSSGKLLTWGIYNHGALGLGDPSKLPIGSLGGHATEEEQAKFPRYIPEVTVPTEVNFDHRLKDKGRVKRYCFTAAVAGLGTVALIVDLAKDEVLPQSLK